MASLTTSPIAVSCSALDTGALSVESNSRSFTAAHFLKRSQSRVLFTPHIHESKNVVKIGRTLCLNPGSSYQDGVLDGALIELKGDEVVRYQLVSG